MSCDSNSRLFSRVQAGISGLSGKRAFAAGAAAGIAGTGLAVFLISQYRRAARRLARVRQPKSIGTFIPQKPKPKPLPGLVITPPAKPIPGLAGTPITPQKASPIPPETRLQAAPVPVRDNAGQQITLANSFRVIRGDGRDTGLAITPYLADAANNNQSQWGVSHVASGALIDGPFSSPQEAQQLAAKLALLRWTDKQVPGDDVSRAKTIISAHHAGRSNS